jgi:heme-degrading monooxygenase HmoA
MSILSTTIYTPENEADAERFAGMAKQLETGYGEHPGFERIILARSVDQPLTFVVLSWWESPEAMRAFSESPAYLKARHESGGEAMQLKVESHRWVPAE